VLSGGNRINPDHLPYYTEWAELTAHPGTWWTQAEDAFGVDSGGAVDAKRLRAFLRGEGARQRKDRHPGLEFTFSAPKSVSVVAFGHPSEALGAKVIEAHEAAVRSALGWLEAHGAVVVHHRPGGVHRFEPARGIYALFRHSTSRAGDPQLHTHVLVPNLAADRSGQLGATDRHILKAWVEPASSVYKLALRAELATMGLRFATPRPNGLSELEGMPERIRRRFSHRRRAIEAHVAELEQQGVEISPRLRRLLGVYTRAKKPTGAEAAEIEDVRSWLRPLLEKHAVDEWLWGRMFSEPFFAPPPSAARAKELLDRLLEDDGALSAMSSWNRKELIAKLPTALPEGASPEALDELVELIEHDERLVRLIYVEETGEVARRARITDLSLVVASEEDLAVPSTLGVRFTSKALLEAEHRILVAAATWVWHTGRRERQVADAVLDEATGSGNNAPPNPGQANLVRHFVCSDRAITLGVGVPGSGKTSAMALCVEAWRRLGVPVVALSFKGRSALELGRAAGMRGSTVDHFLALYDHGRVRIAAGSVILVDEASELSTRHLDRLVTLAEKHRAKLVLLGDDRQRSSIEAGGMFATLLRQQAAAVLSENLRQLLDYEREAIGLVRRGQSEAAFSIWASRGHFRAASRYEDLLKATVDGWLTDRAVFSGSVMMAQSNAEVDALNDLARRALIDQGQLASKPLVEVEATGSRPARAYVAGDRIVLTHNDPRHVVRDPSGNDVGGVLNGMVGTVEHYNHVFRTLVVEVDGGKVALDHSYVRDHSAHGYAFTVAKLQSATIRGRTQILRPETLCASDFLVAASRATDGVSFNFLASPGGAAGEGHPATEHDTSSPQSYLYGLLLSLAGRLDREPVAGAAASVLLSQSEARQLASMLGPEGCSAYRAMWSRYASGRDTYSAEGAKRARLRSLLWAERAEQLRQEVAQGLASAEELVGAEGNLAVARAIEMTASKFENATKKGLRPERRYALEQLHVARLACLYAEDAKRADSSTVSSEDPVLGVALEPYAHTQAVEGVLDVQELPDAGGQLDEFRPDPQSMIATHAAAVLGPLYGALHRQGLRPDPEELVAAAEREPEGIGRALCQVADALGPSWADHLAAQFASYGRAQGWEAATRPHVSTVVVTDPVARRRLAPAAVPSPASAQGRDAGPERGLQAG
jgi:conjugative relaxase-like TrwC/TraI family protein